ncbi:flagellar M-ring protein FliF [Hyphomonas sp. WL0036]|uniref:flagellar basal-body MS-ring/collar protein FliF n=1 Tax=Hyphomonas sediminis TaxID=2866160 RepID=UPI001C7F07BD|nr:flagellar basal-body MS-ring/collar protein FliF [Hyphomonas sediminis]MBY9065779.1 flagellar M-ring protein FliF [Hyphomonas sediminis]
MKFIDNLRALPLSRQLMLAAAALGIIAAMSFLVQGATRDPMTLLYSGLEPSHAGEIIQELDQAGVPYEIKGESIFVPQGKRDSVRFTLAQQGLPRPSVQGYELLDEVNGFSVTSEMYNASYWRAKEGELTRTILAIPGVSSARVHIGANLRSGFSRSQPHQTASVTLTTARDMTSGQAEAIQYMVALAVAGLSADDVAVIDPVKGILAGPNANKTEEPAIAAESQASLLEQKILRLLEPRVGAGNARVSATVDVSRERARTSAVTFDPNSRVIRNRTTNDTNSTNAGSGGGMTVASNLPQGTGGATGSSSSNKGSTETVAYEINETRTEVETLPGKVQKISVAVLLNQQALGIDPTAADATQVQQQMIADFEKLVSSAAGLDTARGDSISVELMPFQVLPADDLVQAPGIFEQLMERYFWSGLQALLLGVVVIVLGVGVVRPMLVQKPKGALAPDGTGVGGAVAGAGAGAGAGTADGDSDPFSYLKDYASERQDEAAALLQQWLTEDQQSAYDDPIASAFDDHKVAVNE